MAVFRGSEATRSAALTNYGAFSRNTTKVRADENHRLLPGYETPGIAGVSPASCSPFHRCFLRALVVHFISSHTYFWIMRQAVGSSPIVI